MNRVATARAAWFVSGATVLLDAGTILLIVLNHGGNCCPNVIAAVAGFVYALVGALIVSRRHAVIGWSFIVAGLFAVLSAGSLEYLLRGIVNVPGSLPAQSVAASLWKWGTVPIITSIILMFLLFPDGRPLGPRWRPVVWFVLAAGALSVLGLMVEPGRVPGNFNDVGKHIANPLGIPALQSVLQVIRAAGNIALVLGGVAALLSLVLRFRRSVGEQREQLRWLVYAPLVGILCFALTGLTSALNVHFKPLDIFLFLFGLSAIVIGIPAAAAVAIMKYRLYDIDIVLNKTVVYAALAGFITAVYVGIVVGIGHAVGQGSNPNVGLSILATGVVAVAFQPVRSRVQRFANRLVYGQRATPYEVLSEFSSRMAGAYANEDLLPRMARILAEGTGASGAKVWLRVGGELRCEAAWPAGSTAGPRPESVAVVDGLDPVFDDATATYPVHHGGELLGALTLMKVRGERLAPAEDKLATDLASQAGLVLRNIRLTEELLLKLDELAASRQRIVAAQDEERRRLERNIHDGAQQQLVALAVKLRLARTLAAKDPVKASGLLQQVESEVTEALEDLRDLARGIYPPLLADKGLVAALQGQARKSPIPVRIEADAIGRYSQDLEAAVYFCVLEALQNVAKYARGTQAVVRLTAAGGRLAFEVEDDGAGYDTSKTSYGTGLQGMADRLAALGGDVAVTSVPGHGTRVHGRVAVAELEPVG
jgi:signal transduction histidine kinase